MGNKICKNCEHWINSKDYLNSLRLGTCYRIGMFWERTKWKEIDGKYQRVLLDKYKDDKAFAQDGSDYRASLETLETFGCNQFEPEN